MNEAEMLLKIIKGIKCSSNPFNQTNMIIPQKDERHVIHNTIGFAIHIQFVSFKSH